MALFDVTIGTVLDNEGGFVDNPSDPGGATNFGITQRFLNAYPEISIRDVRDLTQPDACQIYLKYFWEPYPFNGINNQSIATKYFDTSVNCGIHEATLFCQRAINWTAKGLAVVIDGVFGTHTLAELNQVNPDQFLACYRSEQASFYDNLVKKHPEWQKNLKGWLKRAYS